MTGYWIRGFGRGEVGHFHEFLLEAAACGSPWPKHRDGATFDAPQLLGFADVSALAPDVPACERCRDAVLAPTGARSSPR